MKPGQAVGLVVALIILIALGTMSGGIMENLDADEVMMVQSVGSGNLSVYTTPGWKSQWFGKVSKAHKQNQFWFDPEGEKGTTPIKVRFNDGGHADIAGSFAWEMPLDRQNIINLFTKYGSERGIETALIRTCAERSFYMTGPLMSSTESYAVRRPELLSLMEDQLKNGVYKTQKLDIKAPDPITGEEKTVSVVRIVQDSSGHMERQEVSPLAEFGIRTFNLSLKNIAYDPTVEAQIAAQQAMTMQVQTAIAEAKQSEQRRITTEQNGMADAAKAKWDQEVIKAQAVTQAEQNLEVAELEAKTAEQNKRKAILEGEGEGMKRAAIIRGDNALDKRMETWLEGQRVWAAAFAAFQGDVVPQIVSGGTGATTNAALSFMEVMAASAAKDLAVDLDMHAQK